MCEGVRHKVFAGVMRASFEILNPKHEIRNKSKTQSKKVQNEEALSHEWHSDGLVDAFPRVVNDDVCNGHPWRSEVAVLVIRILGLEFVSEFGFRALDLVAARGRVRT